MRKLQRIAATGTAFFVLAALAGASAQTPPSPQPDKPSATQRLPEGVKSLSGAAADDLIIDATGDTGVDKAAVKAREEREAAADQIVSEGEALLKQGRVNDAIASYKAALDITPDDGLAYRRMAEAYVVAGKLPEAHQAFHKFLVEGFGPGAGNGGVVDTADEWAEYALVLVKTGQPAEAIQRYNHAASLLDYEDSQYHNGQPTLKVLFPEIVMERTQAQQVRYTPERLQALADVMLAYKQQGFWSYKEIKAHAQEAAKLYPDSPAVQYYLGQALSGSYYAVLDSPAKDKAAARAAYQEDKTAEVAAYKKAAELGDDRTAAAAKEWLKVAR